MASSSSSSRPFPFWLGLGFVLIGLGMLTGAYFAWRSQDRFMKETVQAEGEVVDLEWNKGSARAVVKFRAQDELEYTVKGSVWSKPPSHEKGEKVNVAYYPDNPADAR